MKRLLPVVEMRGVSRNFPTPHGTVTVLRRVDFAIFPGEFVIVTGPSGSGKSTVLHLAALLDQPTAGCIMFDGQDVSTLDESDLCLVRSQKVGMVFQNYHLLPHRSVFENVLFRFRYLNHAIPYAKELALRAITTVELMSVARHPARLLSGGEMQRTAIAREIALTPLLLVADEPTGNLDKIAAGVVMDCFNTLKDQGMTILMATHNATLLRYCSRHLQLADGCISEVPSCGEG